MSAAVIHRYGFDELRRFAAAIGTAAGMPPPRALALASHLLWFDAAGAPSLGIATFPSWMEAIEQGRVHPTATGRVVSERTALAVFDGENGLAPLILERAAEVAVEKAREAAVGLVRIVGVGTVPSAAPVAAGIAIGPMAGWVLGPDRRWSLALPSQGGLPLVVDSGLSDEGDGGGPNASGAAGRRPSGASKPRPAGRDGPSPAPALLEGFWLGAEWLTAEGGWLVAAVSANALGAPASDLERRIGRGMSPAHGRLLPEAWESRRRRVREEGVVLEPAAWKSLVHWARRLSVDPPDLVTPRQAADSP